MKKKLALAATLIHAPDLILLDEPSTGWIPYRAVNSGTSSADCSNRALHLHDHTLPGRSGALSSHRLNAPRTGVPGGTPDQVRAALPARCIVSRSRSPGRLPLPSSAMVFEPPGALRRPHSFLGGAGPAEADQAVRWLHEQGYGRVTAREIEPSLEDTFVALLGTRASESVKS